LQESRLLEALQHPNIVRFIEVYKTKKGKLCIIMDYADGKSTLFNICRRGPKLENKRVEGDELLGGLDSRLVYTDLFGHEAYTR
jgi:serine/threonine protein kinase